MVAYPALCKHRPFITWTDKVCWQRNDAALLAWQQGNTGYPIVDAAMRQLNQTGWMHNRLRMIVASFLVKDLLIDWRAGEQYFMSQLLDGDLAANNGGWQWAASTVPMPHLIFASLTRPLRANVLIQKALLSVNGCLNWRMYRTMSSINPIAGRKSSSRFCIIRRR
ncbi:Deoxyribodipyrimidine photo-lyase [Serratia fonticola]|uniref:Deoxyribodipyrimidine photo-lyase n=1 Tax=Serratia fonticola TaxID=47917 RepID=A0A4V6KQL5_SERFO|nr:Deoxyribodipyrimidine photo-lyase [Serratia fonticola]